MEIITVKQGLLQTNTYIVFDENTKEAFVIDPAVKSLEIEAVLKEYFLELKGILITHGHFDHVGAVAELKEACQGATIYMHEAELRKIDRTQVSRTLGMSIKTKPFHVDVFIKDNDCFTCAGMQIQVLHTPGHSSGSVCFVVAGVIFCGDTLFEDGFGRVNFADGSMEEIKKSLARLFALEGDYVVYPGHGELTYMSKERLSNPIFQY